MNIDTPNVRRQFIRDGGSLLLATAGLLAAGATPARADTEDLCECIQGNVLLRHQDGTAIMYTATADTPAARMTALRAALTQAKTWSITAVKTITIELLQGKFAVASGHPLMETVSATAAASATASYTYDIRLAFREGAALIYETPADAKVDWRFFPTDDRLGKHFGAENDQGSTVDMQPRLAAALFSMKPTGKTVENPPGTSGTWGARTGTLFLEGGEYYIRSTLYLTSDQSIICNGTGRAILLAYSEMGPSSGAEVWMIHTMRTTEGSITLAKYSRNIRLLGLALGSSSTASRKLSGIYYGCGQGGEVDVVLANMGHRGLKLMDSTSNCRFALWAVLSSELNSNSASHWVQTGPHLEIMNCWALKFERLSLERLNFNTSTSGKRLSYTPPFSGATPINLPALFAYNSYGLVFDSLAGENNSAFAMFWNCRELHIGAISHQAANTSGVGDTLLQLHYCYDYYIGGITGGYFEYLYTITGSFDGESYPMNNNVFAQAGPLFESSRSFAATVTTLNFVRRDRNAASVATTSFTFINGGYNPHGGLYLQDGNNETLMEIKNGTTHGGESGLQVSTGYGVCIGRPGTLGLFSRARVKAVQGYEALWGMGDPTTDLIPDGCATDWVDISSGKASRWMNRGGTMQVLADYDVP